MAYGLVLVIHILVALFLIGVILIQGGRGGMGEALGGAAAQSLFGGGSNTVMARITAVCAALFMATCLSLAVLSTARGRSVIDRLPATVTPEQLPLVLPQAANDQRTDVPAAKTAGEAVPAEVPPAPPAQEPGTPNDASSAAPTTATP